MEWSIFALGKFADAENTWRESIQIAAEVQGAPLILESILGIASVLVKQKNLERAYEFFLIVTNHSATVEETRKRARQLGSELETKLSS